MTDTYYRKDIDGLRAVAVMLVVIQHAGFNLFCGGYVGVDVFFVISGYLITDVIIRQIEENRFAISNFYLRRIRRIMPVFICVAVVTSVAAYRLLLPQDLVKYCESLTSSFIFLSNVYFLKNSFGYFAQESAVSPLLHTWSLAIEEQFYLVWPLLVMVGIKLIGKRNFSFVASFILFLTFIVSAYLATSTSHEAYFSICARAYEILTGAVLAIFISTIPRTTPLINDVISIAGLSLVVCAGITLSDDSTFPGINALLPCAGTALLIYSGYGDKSIASRLLSLRPVRIIGTVSYSLYLWHWPVYAFLKYHSIELSTISSILIIIALIVISIISWYFIERPFRDMYKMKFSYTLSSMVIIPLTIVLIGSQTVNYNSGFPGRFPGFMSEFDEENFPDVVRKDCHGSLKVGNIDACKLGADKSQVDAMLIGDSYANQYAALVDVFAKAANLRVHDSTSNWLPPISNVCFGENVSSKVIKYSYNRIREAKKYKIIIIAANWDRYGEISDKKYFLYNSHGDNITSSYYTLLDNTINDLLHNNMKVVLISSVNAIGDKMLNKIKYDKAIRKSISTYKVHNNANCNKTVNNLKSKYNNLIIINPNDAICNNDICDIDIDGQVIYREGSHLNSSGAKALGEKYLAKYGNPLEAVHFTMPINKLGAFARFIREAE